MAASTRLPSMCRTFLRVRMLTQGVLMRLVAMILHLQLPFTTQYHR
jgi:hypothetical protein